MSENGTSEVVEDLGVGKAAIVGQLEEVDLYKCKYLLERRASGQLRQQLMAERLERLAFDQHVVEEDIRKYDIEFQKKYSVSLYKVNISDDGKIMPMPVVGAPRPV